MAMMDSLSALAGLVSNQGNPNSTVQGVVARRQRLEEMKRNLAMSGVERNARGAVTSGFASGATPQDVATLEDSIDSDPDTGLQAQEDVAHTRGVNQATNDFMRPDVTRVRNIQKQDALDKLLLPIQERGKYEVEAAKQSQLGTQQRDERLYGQRSALQEDRQAAVVPKVPKADAGVTAKLLSAQSKNKGGFFDQLLGRTPPPSPDVLAAIREVSLQEGTHPALVNAALTLASQNPGASVEQLLQKAAELPNGANMDEEDRADFLNVFSRLR